MTHPPHGKPGRRSRAHRHGPSALAACALALLAGLIACNDSEGSDRCQRAVDHMASPPRPPGVSDEEIAKSAPGEDEQRIIDAVRSMSLATCQREGLSEAQERCILEARTMQERMYMGRCPALRERMPSWLQVPAEEAIEMFEQKGILQPPDTQPEPTTDPAPGPSQPEPGSSPE